MKLIYQAILFFVVVFSGCTDANDDDLFPAFSYELEGKLISVDPYAGSVELDAEPVRINLDIGDDRLYIELASYRGPGSYNDFFIRYINTIPYYSDNQQLLEFTNDQPTYVEGRFEGVLWSPDGSSSFTIREGFFRLRKD